jgi:hypothetical protein
MYEYTVYEYAFMTKILQDVLNVINKERNV